MIERAYTCGAALGLAVWCEDEAGPFQAVPHPGRSWRPQNEPATQPHEYVRGGTAKILTLFQPATGQVRLQPVTRSTNAIVHPWLKTTLTEILAALPAVAASIDGDQTRRLWQAWQEGLTVRFTLPDDLPPLRLLLIWDNLTGHKTPEMVLWLCRHGIMPLYTPLGGSWLNLAEAIQRILKRRALDGQHPQTPTEIGAWFETTAQAWNQQPTPFIWNGKRRQRRRERPGDGHPVGAAAAHPRRPLPRHRKDRTIIPKPMANDPLVLQLRFGWISESMSPPGSEAMDGKWIGRGDAGAMGGVVARPEGADRAAIPAAANGAFRRAVSGCPARA